jgi:polygalacturonase
MKKVPTTYAPVAVLLMSLLLSGYKYNIITTPTTENNLTQYLQNAIDSCYKKGGGIVTIPKGTHMITPIFLKSNITLNIPEGDTLRAFAGAAGYTFNNKLIPLISADSVSNVTITGGGVIDGNGSDWWQRFKDSGKTLRRPRLIIITNGKNITLTNITLTNSPTFHFMPVNCVNVNITGIRIISPSNSPNTDGIDPSHCNHVNIKNCTIDTGDDNIVLKSGSGGSLCQNINIENCTFLHGHGLSIGSETASGVFNMQVKHCTFNQTTNGIRIKSDPSRGGLCDSLVYTDITMKNVKHPLIITFAYAKITGDKIPAVHRLYISNLAAKGSNDAGTLEGLPNSILEKIVLNNLTIFAKTGLVITNANKVKLINVNIIPQTGLPLILTNVQQDQ